jgi:murein L,D-transpeptidase YafK
VQVFPFRMTEENMAARERHPHAEFWRNLKQGFDLFETDRRPPKVAVCDRRYVFEPGPAGGQGEMPIAARCTKPKQAGRT